MRLRIRFTRTDREFVTCRPYGSTRSVFIIFFSLLFVSFHVSGLRRRRRTEKRTEKMIKRKSLQRREMEAVRTRETPTSIHGGPDPEGFAAARFYCIFTTLRVATASRGFDFLSLSHPKRTSISSFLYFTLPYSHTHRLCAIKAPRNRPSFLKTTWSWYAMRAFTLVIWGRSSIFCTCHTYCCI